MTDPSAVPSLKRLALGDLWHELATTRRLLERVPDEHLSWRPHARSFTLGQLAGHISNLLFWQRTTIQQDEFDLASVPPGGAHVPAGREELLRLFDENVAALRAAMEGMEDSALSDPWTLTRAGEVVLQMPRLAVIRGMGINHLVHHRGQLSVYLRLLDIPLPPMYGPTADESA